MRGRGLKLAEDEVKCALENVTPHAGAWIETLTRPGRTTELVRERRTSGNHSADRNKTA